MLRHVIVLASHLLVHARFVHAGATRHRAVLMRIVTGRCLLVCWRRRISSSAG